MSKDTKLLESGIKLKRSENWLLISMSVEYDWRSTYFNKCCVCIGEDRCRIGSMVMEWMMILNIPCLIVLVRYHWERLEFFPASSGHGQRSAKWMCLILNLKIRKNKLKKLCFELTSSSRFAASWFSNSKRRKLCACSSCELSSFGNDSINVSISFAHLKENKKNIEQKLFGTKISNEITVPGNQCGKQLRVIFLRILICLLCSDTFKAGKFTWNRALLQNTNAIAKMLGLLLNAMIKLQ